VSVEFHCSKCSKLIRAPREAAGNRGKCPYCKQSVYIPTPPDELEAIPLAPVDEGPAKAEDASDREAEDLLTRLGRDETPVGEGDPGGPAGVYVRPAEGVADLVAEAVRALQASDLDRVEGLVAQLRQNRAKARSYVQTLMMDEVPPPELESCPPALYSGFLRTLLSRL
jgi:DNA-directed RNA polymerase subunit RPC12/RpoP